LSIAEIAGMSNAQIGAIKASQIVGLTTAEIAAITPSQVTSLSTAAVAALTTAQVAALQTAAVAALTTTQVAALTCAEQQAMTAAQVNAMSNAQINALKLGTPLVLDLDNNGIQTTNIAAGTRFDLHATGKQSGTGWLSAHDGFLVLDRNHDGIINDGSELFGSATRLPNGTRAVNGFEALTALDSNHDGKMDVNDAAFGALQVWVDANQDGKTQAGELHSLTALGIKKLNLTAHRTSIDSNGNSIGLLASYITNDGKTHALADVWLQVDPQAQDRVIDLTGNSITSLQQGSLARIDLSGNGGSGDVLIVNALAIASVGDQELIPQTGQHAMQMVVNGDATDMVKLADYAANWTTGGTVAADGVEYRVYEHDNVQLLVAVRMQLEFIYG
jgi:hypothetical protein